MPEKCARETEDLTPDEQFASDLRTLENMNLDALKKRVKEDFKEVISDLDLDHLLRQSEADQGRK